MTLSSRTRIISLPLLATVALLTACAHSPAPVVADAAPAQVAASAPVAEVAPVVVATPESVLAQGLKAYQAAQYQQSELDLKSALQMGLAKPADLVAANKHLAFIYCTSKREAQCLAAFKAARAADPAFTLSKSEAGHPMWGPVYKRSLSKKKK
jgi:hypothetical protein